MFGPEEPSLRGKAFLQNNWQQGCDLLSDANVATNSGVADMFEISDGTVRRYDKIVLKSGIPPPCFDGLKKLLIDEKSVRKKFQAAKRKGMWIRETRIDFGAYPRIQQPYCQNDS